MANGSLLIRGVASRELWYSILLASLSPIRGGAVETKNKPKVVWGFTKHLFENAFDKTNGGFVEPIFKKILMLHQARLVTLITS